MMRFLARVSRSLRIRCSKGVVLKKEQPCLSARSLSVPIQMLDVQVLGIIK